METKETFTSEDVLEVASEAGHILLENGAEISRVEDTMERISSHYGVHTGHFFVLSNGIFTTVPRTNMPMWSLYLYVASSFPRSWKSTV